MSTLLNVAGGTASRSDIVFVHGLNGDPRLTWQATDDPATFWPAWLGEPFPEFAVWSLDYDAYALNWSGASMPLADRAGNALDLLALHVPDGRPICFVAHSLGGLLVKQVIRRAIDTRHRLATQVRGVVFLGTPHAGSQKASWLSGLGRLVGASVSTVDLKAHSAQLRDLNVWYRDASPTLHIANLTYFETRSVAGLKIVDETSADPGLAGSVPIALDADHISIAKAQSRSDQMYLGVVRFIRECLDRPLAVPSPLKVRFQVKTLDGRTPIDIDDTIGALPGGAKFRMQLTNTGTQRVVVDALHLQMQHAPLSRAFAPPVDAAALRFGDARVPHQLHLELCSTSWRGRWIIQMTNGISVIRSIENSLDNLLETDPPTEFDIAPGGTESIVGSFSTQEPGLYTIHMIIDSIVAGTSATSQSTAPLSLVHFATTRGPVHE